MIKASKKRRVAVASISVMALVASVVVATVGTAQAAESHQDNPYVGATQYVNPSWKSSVETQAGTTTDAGLAAKMRAISNTPTAVWMDRRAAISGADGGLGLVGHLDGALAQKNAAPETIEIVIYDLPGRDCNALASNGELPATEAGLATYKTEYIDPIAATLANAKYADLRIVTIIEPDSLPNITTNASVSACATAAPFYEQGVAYALDKLHAIPNVYTYLDMAHSGWLGWPDNASGAAAEFMKVANMTAAKTASVDGFISDTANYTPVKEPYFTGATLIGGQPVMSGAFYEYNPDVDEATFTADMYTRLTAAGFPATIGMLIDTSRNGWGGAARPSAASTATSIDAFVDASKIDRRTHRGAWCNQSGAGIGELPTVSPAGYASSHLDAFVWIKPPGESDGASTDIPNTEGKRFDRMCDPTYSAPNLKNNLSGALADSPLAGQWFAAQFTQLVQNAYPVIGGTTPPANDTTPPSVPGGLTATAPSSSSITLAWTASTDDSGIAPTYDVYRSTTLVTNVAGTSYTDTGLTPSTPYSYTVRARDGSNNISTPSTAASATTQAGVIGTTPVGINGQLHVCGVNLCNQYNFPIQLRGMSTHGLQWFPACYNNASLDALANDWDADLLRIAMYVQEGGYETDPTAFTNQVNSYVDMAEARGMYAVIDFHTLTPGDPNFNLANAKTFFASVATRNAAKNNVIYEIANEPNGVSWAAIKSYAEQVIPVIRAADPNAVIIVGTRGWSSLGISDGANADEIVNAPVNATNIMYAFHFYAASHGDNYRTEVTRASALLPLFVSEFGTVSASGGGAMDTASSTAWLDLLDQKKISYANWTYSDANESSAAFQPGTCAGTTYAGTGVLTASGVFVRSRIMTPDDFPTGTGGTDTQPPTAPTGVSSTGSTASSISLSWTASTDNVGVTGYQVLRNGVVVGSPTTTTYTDTGLTASTAYSYTVVAFDAAANTSAASSAVSATTSGTTTDTTAPTVPTGLAVTGTTSTSVSLSWTASTDAVGVTGYDVYRAAVKVATATGTTYTDTGLMASTAYSYTVVAFDAAGNRSAASTPLSVTTAAQTTGGITVQYKNNDTAPTDNQIKPGLQIVNTGTAALSLSTVTVRYYFTREAGASTFSTYCDYAAIDCANVKTKVVQMLAPVAGADAYLEVSFTGGSVAAGGNSGAIQLRLNKTDWSNFVESDDYSYGTGTAYADASKAVGYVNGVQAWGAPPA